jgi:hypothetical protein
MRILATTAPVITVASTNLQQVTDYYTTLLDQPVRSRFRNPAGTLELVLIGSMLLIGGEPHNLATRTELNATYIVDDLDSWHDELPRRGCRIVEEPSPGPMNGSAAVGTFMFVRHPDGGLYEYVQLRN